MSEEQATAKKAQQDIVSRLNRIDDSFQKNMHLGSLYSAAGDLRTSTERYVEARRAGEALRKAANRYLPPC